jgi:ABC-type transport system involved in multi-copper enzyme maturation permease subunit
LISALRPIIVSGFIFGCGSEVGDGSTFVSGAGVDVGVGVTSSVGWVTVSSWAGSGWVISGFVFSCVVALALVVGFLFLLIILSSKIINQQYDRVMKKSNVNYKKIK